MNFGSALEQVHRRAPLVDCITNFVTVNDCANILLAVGGSPTMASDIREVQETAAAASALLCNRQSGVHDFGRAGGQPGRQTRGL